LAGLFKVKDQSQNHIQTSLQEYAKSREIDRRATIGITDFLARVFTSPLLPVRLSRGFALTALQWVPPFKTTLARQMMFGRR